MTPEASPEPVHARRARLERLAMELARACPAAGGNPPECPLRQLRSLPAGRRRTWIHRLTLEELEYLESYHQTCYFEKVPVEPP